MTDRTANRSVRPLDSLEKPGGAASLLSSLDLDTDKQFSTLRARLALVGYTLARSDLKDGRQALCVTRWGIVKTLASLEEVERVAVQLGAPA